MGQKLTPDCNGGAAAITEQLIALLEKNRQPPSMAILVLSLYENRVRNGTLSATQDPENFLGQAIDLLAQLPDLDTAEMVANEVRKRVHYPNPNRGAMSIESIVSISILICSILGILFVLGSAIIKPF